MDALPLRGIASMQDAVLNHQHPLAGMRLLPSTPPSVWNPCERKGRMIMTPDSNDAEDIICSIDLVGTSGQSCWLAELIEPLLLLVQSGSTRPERIPASLAGLQQVNSKTLHDLQQHLQAHLTAAQKELRAQVTLLHVVWVGEGGGAWSNRCTCSARLIVESEVSSLLACLLDNTQHHATKVYMISAHIRPIKVAVFTEPQQSSCPPVQLGLIALDWMPPQVVSSAGLQLNVSMHCCSNMMPSCNPGLQYTCV